ncbi:MAG: chemotaxis protein CheX, partial [bacterium]|nr:chemotaxis protein CheX [bacterium]
RSSDRTLEQICVDDGYLTPDQLESLKCMQREGWIRIGDALVRGGHLTREMVEEELAIFASEVARVEEHLQQELEEFDDTQILKTFFNLSAHHFARITGRTVKLSSVESSEATLAAGYRRFAQRFNGTRTMTLAIDLPETLTSTLAGGMLGTEDVRDIEAAHDAVCEFVNVVGGNACTRLESLGLGLRPEPPFTSGGSVPVAPDGESIHAVAVSEESEFDFHVFFEAGDDTP